MMKVEIMKPIKPTEPFFLQLYSSNNFPSSANMEFISDQISFSEWT